MAKRKRLTPARPDYLEAASRIRTPSAVPAMAAPIAQVAGEASAAAALSEVTEVLEQARAEGRMVELLSLEVIDETHLVRDRLAQDEAEMAALMGSLRARGQQMPIEVIALPVPKGPYTHGLISGWRRLTALRRLYKETGDPRFAEVRALVIAPDTAEDAYVAMVEENEIRVNLSHYERARIAVRAVREGVYPTQRAALKSLFGNVARSKRSKIGTFVQLVEALDDVLKYPAAISEKLGLALAREMARDPDFANTLIKRVGSAPRDSFEDEIQVLATAVADQNAPPARPSDHAAVTRSRKGGSADGADQTMAVTRVSGGLEMRFSPQQARIELVGTDVTEEFTTSLERWLRSL